MQRCIGMRMGAVVAGAVLAGGLAGAPAASAPRAKAPAKRAASPPSPRKTAAPAQPPAPRGAPRPRPQSLTIAPASVSLAGPRAEQAVIVTAHFADGTVRDVTAEAKLSVEGGRAAALAADGPSLRPLRDGEASLRADYAGRTARAPVVVSGAGTPRPVSFTVEVMPVLTFAGCNQAACHGAQGGKGGLQLSLFGYDPAADHAAIAGAAGGGAAARLDRTNPDESLLLRKARLDVAHGGGRRIARGSLPERVLRDWIAGGAPPPGSGPSLRRIEVTPRERRFAAPPAQPGAAEAQRLLVRAFYDDGSERDVTSLARFDAQDADAVEVSAAGSVTPVRPGASAVMVRFGGQVAAFGLEVPFARPATRIRYPRPLGMIDERIFARLERLGLPLSAPAEDLEFLRRVSLDLAGTLPTPDEARAFAAECESERRATSPGVPDEERVLRARARLVESLLKREEHVSFWTQKWSDLLKVNSRDLGQEGMLAYYGFIQGAVRSNMPWDRMARELLLSQARAPGAGAYYATARNAEERAVTTAEVFLGVRIQCAQCHQHPFEAWSQDDFWQFAAYFARVPGPPSPALPGRVRRLTLERPEPAPREVMNPRTGKPAFPPKPLGAAAMDPAAAEAERREHLADWLTAPDNPWFARSFVNRVWRHFFGRGIVDPVDDLRATNPASDPELLDALARQFTSSGYDVRELIRQICASRTYQTSSRPLPGNRDDTRFFSHAYFRRLTAEQLADAIAQVTGIPDEYPPYPRGTRAIQLPDPQVIAPFLDVFGRPGRTQACECERTNEPTIGQALRLITGPGLSSKATAANGRIARLMFFTEKKTDEIWEELYYWSLGRPPRAAERRAWQAHTAERRAAAPNNRAGADQEALEDWFWALLNSKEFLFNH